MKVFKTFFPVLFFFLFASSSFAQPFPALNCDLINFCFDTLPKLHITVTEDQISTYAHEGALAMLEDLPFENELSKVLARETIKSAPTYKALCDSLTQIYETTQIKEKDLPSFYEDFLSETIHHIDPHTAFHTPEEFQQYINQMNGQNFKGLGIVLSPLGKEEHGPFYVSYIMPDSSTLPRGLQVDDTIIKINDKTCSELALSEFQEIIRSNSGSLSLTIQRADQTIEVTGVIAKELFFPRVHTHFINSHGLAYIQILSFSENLASELTQALLHANLKGMILDLRDNGGGDLHAAIAVADLFLDRGLVAFTKDRAGKIEELWAPVSGELASAPLLILVNSGSASASELFTAALQDHGRALVVGSPSYGKGTVQNLWNLMINPLEDSPGPLSKYGGTIRYTRKFYYRPTGEPLQLRGITPDIEIKNPEFKEIYEKDYKNALTAEPMPRPFQPTYEFRRIAKERLTTEELRQEFTEFEQKDIQLTQAIDMLEFLTGQPRKPNHFGKAYIYPAPYHRLHINCDLWTPEIAKDTAFLVEFKFRHPSSQSEIYKTYGFMVGRELTLSLENTPLQATVKKEKQGSFILDITVYQKTRATGELKTYTHSTIVDF